MTRTDRRAVCYTLTEYPGVSNTFIREEIRALRAGGVEIVAVPVRRSADAQVLSADDEVERELAVPVLPLSTMKVRRGLLEPALRHPRAFLTVMWRALRTGGTDVRNVVWALFHFVEALQVWRACADAGITHIHAHFASVSSNLAWFAAEFANEAREADEPEWTWSFTMHGYHEFIEQKAHRLDLKIASASRVICIADYIRSQLMRLSHPRYWDKLTVVHCGIDLSKFAYSAPERADGAFRVLHIGRLAEEKGQPLMVEAIADLVGRGHDVRLDVIGAGPLEEAVRTSVDSAGLEDRVTLHGARGHDEIADWYRRSDAFCLPSFVEGVPVVLMEAMACGVPVVTTGITGIPELVEDGVSGLLVRPGRADLLADALERLIVEDGLAASLASAARVVVESDFDVDTTAPMVAEVLGRYAGGQ